MYLEWKAFDVDMYVELDMVVVSPTADRQVMWVAPEANQSYAKESTTSLPTNKVDVHLNPE